MKRDKRNIEGQGMKRGVGRMNPFLGLPLPEYRDDLCFFMQSLMHGML